MQSLCIWSMKVITQTSFAMLLIIIYSVAHAGQTHRTFNITVNLQTSATINPVTQQPTNSAFCRVTDDPAAFGATYTIVCATGAVVDISPGRSGMPLSPMHGGAYRYLFQANRGGNQLGTIDSYLGVGTITSWRVVNLRDRDYLEMLVNW
jgi:hypothetical protein